jgi:hypothetical protein
MRYYDQLVGNLKQWNDMSENERNGTMVATARGRLAKQVYGEMRASYQADVVQAANISRRSNTNYDFRHLQLMFEQPETKRILFDSRQAETFDQMDLQLPENWKGKLKLPFDFCYLEFTDPIELSTSKEQRERSKGGEVDTPGLYSSTEKARALLIGYIPSDRWVLEGTAAAGLGDTEAVIMVNLFFEDWDDNGKEMFVHRAWFLNRDWQPLIGAGICRQAPDPSVIPWNPTLNDLIIAGSQPNLPDRHIGWWEKSTLHHTELLRWMVLYMMAKSIVIVEEPISRQQRRALERKELPNPWHIVKVEPKFQKGGQRPDEDTGIRHGYRYDVTGHLRFGRHRRGDGSYSETIEWIAPHQRGLANELYIPKISKFEGGKVAHERMLEYLGEPKPSP